MLSLAEMWAAGSIFALAATAIRYIGKRRLPQFFFYWLWNFTILIFFLPVSIPSPVSVYNLIPVNAQAGRLLPVKLCASGMASASSGAVPGLPTDAGLTEAVTAVWIIGMAIVAVYFIALELYWIASSHAAKENRTELYIDGKRCRVSLLDGIETPCVIGVFRPVICFPATWDFKNKLDTQLALRHERLHISHFDNGRKLLLRLLLCCQWFNPCVWMVYHLANKDMELYCDSSVVANGSRELRQRYALLLLNNRTAKPTVPPCSLAGNQKTAVSERIVLIMTKKSPGTILTVACVLGLVGLLSAFATMPLPQEPAQDAGQVEMLAQDVGQAEMLAPGQKSAMGQPKYEQVNYSECGVDLPNGDTLLIGCGKLSLTLSIAPIMGYEHGQPAEYGYVQNGNCVAIGEASLYDGITLEFAGIPESAENLYIKNYCVDTIHILSV